MRAPRPGRRWRAGAPALGLLAVVVVAYWPLVWHLRTQFWSDSGDGAAFIWNYWSVPHALLAGHNPFVTHSILFPVGAHTAFDTNVPLWSVLSWPLARVFGLPVASVLIGLTAVVASGAGAYLLARRLDCSAWVAFFAGVAFELLPYRTNRIITHLNLIHTELLAFGILAAVDLYRERTRGRALLLGLVLGLTVLTDFTYALMLLLSLAVLGLLRLRQTVQREMLVRLLQAAGLAVVLSLPVLIPAAQDVRAGEYAAQPGLGGAQGYSADLLSWVVPYNRQPLWGSVFDATNAKATGGERVEFTGFVVLGLAVVGLIAADRRKWEWLALAGVFGLLSFGPGLHVNGKTGSAFSYDGFRFSIPMPLLALEHLPGFRGFRAPARFGVVASLALILLAALGMEWLVRRWPRRAVLLPVAATLLVAIEFLPPGSYLTLPAAQPAAYRQMAQDPSPGAVLDLPLQFRTGYGVVGDQGPPPGDDSRFMYEAVLTGRPMAGGSVSRLPERRMAALQAIPVYAQILRLQGDAGAEGGPATFTPADLHALGIRFVVDHHEAAKPAVVSYLASLQLPVFAQDSSVTVWKVPG